MSIKWGERHSNHTAAVGKVGFIQANWHEGGYKVFVFGNEASARPAKKEDAKALAIRIARRLLTEALAALPEPEKAPPEGAFPEPKP